MLLNVNSLETLLIHSILLSFIIENNFTDKTISFFCNYVEVKKNIEITNLTFPCILKNNTSSM